MEWWWRWSVWVFYVYNMRELTHTQCNWLFNYYMKCVVNFLKQALFIRHSYEDTVILLISHIGVKILFNKTSRLMANDSPSREPTYSHQVGCKINLAFMYAVYYQGYSKRIALS